MRNTCILIVILLGIFNPEKASGQNRKGSFEYPPLIQRGFDIYLQLPDSSIQLARKILSDKESPEHDRGIAFLLLSKSYWVKANYRLSTEYGFKALDYFESTKDIESLTHSLITLGRTLTELGSITQARHLMHRAKTIAVANKNESLLGETYREYSFLLTETDDLDSAIYYIDKAIPLFRRQGDSLDVSVLYSRKARIFFKQENFSGSYHFALLGLGIDSMVNNKRALGISYYQVAQNELQLKHHTRAEKFAKNCIQLSNEIGNKLWLVRGHELLARIYLGQEKLPLSNAELQIASAFKDSLNTSEKSGQIQELQTLYELKEKDNTIKLLEQERALRDQGMQNQRLLLTVLVVGMLLLIAVIFILTRLRSIQQKTNRDLQQKNSAIEQQREELQVQAEKLQELNQLQHKLFSVISHDLRGPISNLQTLLDLYTKNIVSPEEFIDVSTKLNRNLTITQQTLENLLSWAMSQMHGLKTEKRIIDVHQSIDEASHLLEEFVARKSIHIERIREGSLLVYADPNQLQLILRNVIHNAIKFSKIGDVVTIKAEARGEFCFVTIADTGIGMTDTEMNLLDGSHKHFSKPGTQQEKGTGLGLLLCKEFIERNGGSLSIESTAGMGTKVIFSLELADHLNSIHALDAKF